MRVLIACILALTCAPAVAAPATAKTSATTSYSERMALLAKLVGDWRGSGWMILPNGKRESFVSQETVSRRLSGHALLVEGQHRSANGQLVHDAMAMITWNERAGGYRMRTALSSGFGGDFPLEVTPGGFAWRMDVPGGHMEYVAQFQDDVWTERGRRISTDGRSTDFFEMRLQRLR